MQFWYTFVQFFGKFPSFVITLCNFTNVSLQIRCLIVRPLDGLVGFQLHNYVTGHNKRLLSVQTVFQESEVWRMKCFRNVTFKIWNVSEMESVKDRMDWEEQSSKIEMFQKHDVKVKKCFRIVTFRTWYVSEMLH